MALAYDARRATVDVDAIFVPAAEVRKAAARVAERLQIEEDWLNDGVPLAAPVARECIGGWYGANAPARGAWRVAGLPVDRVRLNAIARAHRLRPPARCSRRPACIAVGVSRN